MDPEERAFYEGAHLISETSSEHDLFAPPVTEVSKLLAKQEKQRIEREQERKEQGALLNGEEDGGSVEEDNGSVEGKNNNEDSHPYAIVFGNDISQLVVDKQKQRTVLYTGPDKKS